MATKINKKQIEKIQKQGKSKKAIKEENKSQRVLIPWNTGTQTHKSKRNYDRKQTKQNLRREVKENTWQNNKIMIK